jgi:hypothetical protein
VLSVEAPRHVSGVSGKGKQYSFWNLGIQLWTGNKAVACSLRADDEKSLPEVTLGLKRTFKVSNARVNNGQMQFDLEA